jgi:two-component system cell cycle sensor histidine kinase/response regulator CckA
MKIKQKLVSSFLLSSVLILIIGYIGVREQERLGESFEMIAGEVMPGTYALTKMASELYHSLAYANEYALMGNVSTKEELNNHIADLRKNLMVHRLLHSRHDAPENMQIIEKKIDMFIDSVTEYILLRDRNGTEEELDDLEKKLNRIVDDFTASFEPFIRQHITRSRGVIAQAKERIDRSSQFILAASVVIVFISVALGLFMARLISTPILKLAEAAARIGKGDLDTRIEVASKDEIGELASSFNRMASDLKSVTVSRDSFAHEVVERKRAEEALRESEGKLTGIVQSMTDSMTMLDEKYRIVWANDVAKRLFGAQLVGEKCYAAFGKGDRPCEPCVVKKCFEDGEVHQFETKIIGPGGEGKAFWGTVNVAARYEDDTPKMVIKLLRDVTERKRKEKEIAGLKQQIEFVLGATKTGLSVIDSELNIRYIDPASEKTYGNPAGRTCNEYFVGRGDISVGSRVQKALKIKTVAVTEEVLLKENNRPVQVTTIPFQNQEGEWLVAEVTVDITERKMMDEEKEKVQAQLLHAQKMEAIGTLAGGISHDFNNILQAISGYIELLSLKIRDEDLCSNYLAQVARSAERASELTGQLMIFGRKVKSELKPTDLNQGVTQVHKLLQRTIPKMIDFELDLAEEIKIINADPTQLEQIMMNLGINAKDAMPDGGRLVFETKNVILDEEYCRAHAGAVPGEYVLLTVSDNGHGMSRETLAHIFEPFFTTKEVGRGTGLGLSMVYGIIKSHRGYITCDSEPGRGTVFKIYFPAIQQEETRRTIDLKKEPEIRGGQETILLVDDEEPLLLLGQDILGQSGYATIRAESGEKAVEVFSKKKGLIDLVVLDLGMPGMGGLKCLQSLLAIDPEIKVIVASGYTGSDEVKKALEYGAAKFVCKPYRYGDMLHTIRELLDRG